MAEGSEWNFDPAVSTAAGVIPTLLLALVLQKELLPIAAKFSAHFRQQAEKPPKLIRLLLNAVPTGVASMRLSAELLRPSNMVALAVLAELLALYGVAQPAVWRTDNPGRLIAFVSLAFIAFVIFELLLMLAMGLMSVAGRAEAGEDGSPAGPEAVDEA